MGILDWFGNKAIRELETKLKRHPDNPRLHFELGVAYDARGMEEKAVAAFEKTLELNPNSAEAHFNLAHLYERQNNGRKAITHILKAGNLFAERNDIEHKDLARQKLREYYKKFGSGDEPLPESPE